MWRRVEYFDPLRGLKANETVHTYRSVKIDRRSRLFIQSFVRIYCFRNIVRHWVQFFTDPKRAGAYIKMLINFGGAFLFVPGE